MFSQQKFLFVLSSALLFIAMPAAMAEEPRFYPIPKLPYVKSLPYSGKVVDAITKQPIEGVIVIAYWPVGYDVAPRWHKRQLPMIIETVTDYEGNYSIPGWEIRDSYLAFHPSDPEVIFFKIGYWTKYVSNRIDYERMSELPDRDHPWQAEWDGEMSELKEYDRDPKTYRKSLGITLDSSLEKFLRPCNYLRVPRLLLAIEEYYKTQPDYREPGWQRAIGDIPTEQVFRRRYDPRMPMPAEKKEEKKKPKVERLPRLNTINTIRSEGTEDRCGITPVDYLKRISSNEMDFMHYTGLAGRPPE